MAGARDDGFVSAHFNKFPGDCGPDFKGIGLFSENDQFGKNKSRRFAYPHSFSAFALPARCAFLRSMDEMMQRFAA
jgi:hypothetical protein